VVIKVKGKLIRTSPTASLLETCNNHQKMAKTVTTLLKSRNRTAVKRVTNTNSNTVVSQKKKQKPK
jgi:predicted RNA-binding protein with PUA-like domain